MNKNRNLAHATVFGFLLVAFSPRIAHAYIDPGVGLLVLQGLFASSVGLIFFGRRLIGQAFRALTGKRSPAPAPVTPGPDSSQP